MLMVYIQISWALEEQSLSSDWPQSRSQYGRKRTRASVETQKECPFWKWRWVVKTWETLQVNPVKSCPLNFTLQTHAKTVKPVCLPNFLQKERKTIPLIPSGLELNQRRNHQLCEGLLLVSLVLTTGKHWISFSPGTPRNTESTFFEEALSHTHKYRVWYPSPKSENEVGRPWFRGQPEWHRYIPSLKTYFNIIITKTNFIT